jgi:3-oxoacyl-[acyl-carrier protein] reductase
MNPDEGVARERLRGRTALVTGSTSGIGRGVATMFAEQGARVIVTGRRVHEGSAVVREIREAGGTAVFDRADLTRPAEARRPVASAPALARSADGRIDRTNATLWDATYRADVRSAMLWSKYALPALIASGRGSIINMSSIHAQHGKGWDAYAAAKGALLSLTRSMAVGCARDHVRVNCICPGFVIVERNQGLLRDDPKALKRVRERLLTRLAFRATSPTARSIWPPMRRNT